MEQEQFMKRPCKHCPFRNDVKPYLRYERFRDLAYATQNPYNSFACHKTTEYDENEDGEDMVVTENSKECAGFLTMQVNEGKKCPDGFEPAWNIVHTDAFEMIQHFDLWEEEEQGE